MTFRQFLEEDKKQEKTSQDMWDKAYHDVNKDWDEPSQKQHKINDDEELEIEVELEDDDDEEIKKGD